MKNLMENLKRHLNSDEAAVEYLFCTLGNGIELDLKGYISKNYRGSEAYKFGPPQPFRHIYPWSDTEQFQPFRKLAGCRDVGFKEMAEYFLGCLEVTPDDIPDLGSRGEKTSKDIKKWKENIGMIREVLLETPTIKEPFESIEDGPKFIASLSGKDTSYSAKWDGPSDGESSVSKVWYFDAQWSDCPDEVEAEVQQIWKDYDLGNDHYMFKTTLDEGLFESYPRVYFWLEYKGVQKGEEVIVHWWW